MSLSTRTCDFLMEEWCTSPYNVCGLARINLGVFALGAGRTKYAQRLWRTKNTYATEDRVLGMIGRCYRLPQRQWPGMLKLEAISLYEKNGPVLQPLSVCQRSLKN